ncbi:MAG: hypothetical protein K2M19_08590 [Muribaculaceae bacterium]|nr:hypothetical protein [Muribaculaceae bacterium]
MKKINPKGELIIVLLSIVFTSVFTSCDTDEPYATTYNWNDQIHLRLLTKDGQNLFNVDPELFSVINDEFTISIRDDVHKERELELLRTFVRPVEDTTYIHDWFAPGVTGPEGHLPWTLTTDGELRPNGTGCLYAQFSQLYGYSPKDLTFDGGHYILVSTYFCLTVTYGEWDCIDKDRTFHIKIDWPRGGMSWDFEHQVPAGHRGDKLFLNGRELNPATDKHDLDIIDIIIEDKSLYKDSQYHPED